MTRPHAGGSIPTKTITRLPISAVGITYNAGGYDVTTLDVTTINLNDILIVSVGLQQASFPQVTLSGGGVTVWEQMTDASSNFANYIDQELFIGVVTAVGNKTITLNGSNISGYNTLQAQEFTCGSSIANWAFYGCCGIGLNYGQGGGGTLWTPQLVPQGLNELYFAGVNTNQYEGVTPSVQPGWTSELTPAPNEGVAMICWYPNASNPTNYFLEWIGYTSTSFNQAESAVLIYANESVLK